MLSPLRNRFGIPGVISVIALVFALFGGAYAASNSGDGASATASAKKRGKKGRQGGLNAKQKRQVIALAKRFAGQGPAGPQGVPGLPGPAGAKGSDGSDGSDGDDGNNGTPGQSVTTAAEPPFGNCGEQEGVKLTSASGTNFVCNGANGAQGATGSPWTAGGTLPAGATQTGVWYLNDDSPTFNPGFGSLWNITTISFPIPLESPLDSAHVKVVQGSVPAECEDPGHPGAAGTTNPEAASGYLCLFQAGEEEEPAVTVTNLSLEDGTETTGAIIYKFQEAEGDAKGGFAVTG